MAEGYSDGKIWSLDAWRGLCTYALLGAPGTSAAALQQSLAATEALYQEVAALAREDS
jgi:hypothetical protein